MIWWMKCALATAALCVWLPAAAAESAARLRVTERNAVGQIGTFGGLRVGTLLLVGEDGTPRNIALSAIETLERSRGVHGHSLAGAAIGFGAGAVVGGVIGGALQPREGTGSNASFAAGGALLVGGAGALLGALIGAGARSESWRPMPVQDLRLLIGFGATGEPAIGIAKQF